MREAERDPFDGALDDALATYGAAPERQGLEARILFQVRRGVMRERPKGRLAIIWGAMAAVACCLVWLEVPKAAIRSRPVSATQTREKRVIALPMLPMRAREIAILLSHAGRRKSAPLRPEEPKLPRFPASLEMGSEERALLRLATGDTKNIPRELTQIGGPIEPLQIAAIEIKPLE